MFRTRIILAALCLVGALGVRAANADPVGGPKRQIDRVEAYSSTYYTLPCWGGQITGISIDGDNDTDLDLYVYDNRGNLLARGDSYSDFEEVFVTLSRNQTLTIEVRNLGNVYNEFVITAW
jgi:hypothetical protein